MSWADVAEAAASGRVEIASHTQSMHASSGARRGCRINPGEDEAAYSAALNADLERVEASIERAAGERPYIFAYPFGFTCEEAARVLTTRGYAAALTCEGRVNTLTRGPRRPNHDNIQNKPPRLRPSQRADRVREKPAAPHPRRRFKQFRA